MGDKEKEEWTAMKAKEEANFFLEEHMAYLDWLMKNIKSNYLFFLQLPNFH